MEMLEKSPAIARQVFPLQLDFFQKRHADNFRTPMSLDTFHTSKKSKDGKVVSPSWYVVEYICRSTGDLEFTALSIYCTTAWLFLMFQSHF